MSPPVAALARGGHTTRVMRQPGVRQCVSRRTRVAVLAAVWLGSCAAGRPAPNAPTRGATRQPGPPSAGQFAQDTPPLSSEATFHYLRAVLLLEDGNPPAAVEAAKEALVFDGGSAVLHALLARALLAAGRTGEALAASEKALSLAPEAVDVQRVRVDVLWRAGRRADAESLLKRLQHATPGDVAVASMLMEVQLARGDLVAAQRSQHARHQLAHRFQCNPEAFAIPGRIELRATLLGQPHRAILALREHGGLDDAGLPQQ